MSSFVKASLPSTFLKQHLVLKQACVLRGTVDENCKLLYSRLCAPGDAVPRVKHCVTQCVNADAQCSGVAGSIAHALCCPEPCCCPVLLCHVYLNPPNVACQYAATWRRSASGCISKMHPSASLASQGP
jgi:hypothetical protein